MAVYNIIIKSGNIWQFRKTRCTQNLSRICDVLSSLPLTQKLWAHNPSWGWSYKHHGENERRGRELHQHGREQHQAEQFAQSGDEAS
jgi:hypothetical protein